MAQVTHPALLVSYVYMPQFQRERERYGFRDYSLDSGAFSAHNSGKEISLSEYTEFCADLLANDEKLTECFALDVIGDSEASLRNVADMWRQGVPAMPTYHYGEPLEVLLELAACYPKIALGGAVGVSKPAKRQWHEQCFAHVWPKRMHGLGVGGRDGILALPWHSVDATNWEAGPTRFGGWKHYGKMSVRGGEQNLRPEVEHALDLERLARQKFGALLADELEGAVFDLRLAYGGPPEALAKGLRK